MSPRSVGDRKGNKQSGRSSSRRKEEGARGRRKEEAGGGLDLNKWAAGFKVFNKLPPNTFSDKIVHAASKSIHSLIACLWFLDESLISVQSDHCCNC